MRKLHRFLKFFLFAQIGSCSGYILRIYNDCLKHPYMYEIPYVSLYSRVAPTIIRTAITVVITVVAYLIVGHKIKRRSEDIKVED